MADNTALETKKDDKKPATLTNLLSDQVVRKRFEEILKDKAPGFISSILSLYNANEQLRNAEPQSILQAAVVAATLDLPINQNLGFAFIVPYGKIAQFQMGAKGFIQLAIRTGKYETIHATEVYKDEIKTWNALTGEFEPTDPSTWKMRENKKPEEIAGYLSFFKLTNGYRKYWYWTVAEVTAHARKYSKSFDSPAGQWKQNFKVMALKTVVKLNLSKWGILSIEMQKAMDVDQAAVETTGEITYPDRAEAEPVPSKPTGADKKISEDQFKLLCARIDKSGINPEEVMDYIRTEFNLVHRHDLTIEQLTMVLKWLENAQKVA